MSRTWSSCLSTGELVIRYDDVRLGILTDTSFATCTEVECKYLSGLSCESGVRTAEYPFQRFLI